MGYEEGEGDSNFNDAQVVVRWLMPAQPDHQLITDLNAGEIGREFSESYQR